MAAPSALAATTTAHGLQPPSALHSEAGFIEIEPITFTLQGEGPRLELTSSPGRIFYSFHPADRQPDKKPLFVFFNGGPGCPTSDMLMSMNTGPYSADLQRTGGKPLAPNPLSWTQLGNLLYLDAPDTGFSYLLGDQPENPEARATVFDARNFNPFIDAAQMGRALLRILAAHPEIQANPVVLVAESYGGVRASTLLNELLFYPRFGDGTRIYQDLMLVAEIQRHLDTIHPNDKGVHTPEDVAQQFGRQILIEPELTGEYASVLSGEMYEAPGSLVHKVAEEERVPFVTCEMQAALGIPFPCDPYWNAQVWVTFFGNRDIYNVSKPGAWSTELDDFAGRTITRIATLSQMLGADATAIPGFAAEDRTGAFRYRTERESDLTFSKRIPIGGDLPVVGPAIQLLETAGITLPAAIDVPLVTPDPKRRVEAGSLEQVLGVLPPWDEYQVDCNMAIYDAFFDNQATAAGYRIDPESPLYGELFLQNLPLVETMITDADYDMAIFPPALPPSLLRYTDLVSNVEAINAADATTGSASRDDFIIVEYVPGALQDLATPVRRSIYFPHYPESGHSISSAQPREFFEDVREWLSWVKQ
ncbi:MAG: hypothetical protein IPK16_23430 [Anaerolineales bacterium]|nr:hypothetical protein [Anaerolineales bacterium]